MLGSTRGYTSGENRNNGRTNFGNNGWNREWLGRRFFTRRLSKDCDRPLASKYTGEKDGKQSKEDHLTAGDSSPHRRLSTVSKTPLAHEPLSHNS